MNMLSAVNKTKQKNRKWWGKKYFREGGQVLFEEMIFEVQPKRRPSWKNSILDRGNGEWQRTRDKNKLDMFHEYQCDWIIESKMYSNEYSQVLSGQG